MAASLHILIVDFHAESRVLLARTLLRKFPDAMIEEFDDAEPAAERVRQGGVTAIVTHRTFDMSGADLVRRFRSLAPHSAIVLVSGMDRSEVALAAGADAFLHYDEWLRIGTVLAEILAAKASNRAVADIAPAGARPNETPDVRNVVIPAPAEISRPGAALENQRPTLNA